MPNFLLEMHRTDEEHEYHLTLKTYVFEFVNNFAPFFYIAFFKTRFAALRQNYPNALAKTLYRLEPGQRVEVFGYELLDQVLASPLIRTTRISLSLHVHRSLAIHLFALTFIV